MGGHRRGEGGWGGGEGGLGGGAQDAQQVYGGSLGRLPGPLLPPLMLHDLDGPPAEGLEAMAAAAAARAAAAAARAAAAAAAVGDGYPLLPPLRSLLARAV